MLKDTGVDTFEIRYDKMTTRILLKVKWWPCADADLGARYIDSDDSLVFSFKLQNKMISKLN